MAKKLCDLKKVLKSDLRLYVRLVDSPTHVCTTCGRVANEKKRLCDPSKIKG